MIARTVMIARVDVRPSALVAVSANGMAVRTSASPNPMMYVLIMCVVCADVCIQRIPGR